MLVHLIIAELHALGDGGDELVSAEQRVHYECQRRRAAALAFAHDGRHQFAQNGGTELGVVARARQQQPLGLHSRRAVQ